MHVPLGKASFEPAALEANFRAVLDELQRAKPASAKGRYLRKITVSSTMGPGVRVDTAACAPRRRLSLRSIPSALRSRPRRASEPPREMASYVYDEYRLTLMPRADGAYDAARTGPRRRRPSGDVPAPLDGPSLERAVLSVAGRAARAVAVSRDVGGAVAPEVDAEELGPRSPERCSAGGRRRVRRRPPRARSAPAAACA